MVVLCPVQGRIQEFFGGGGGGQGPPRGVATAVLASKAIFKVRTCAVFTPLYSGDDVEKSKNKNTQTNNNNKQPCMSNTECIYRSSIDMSFKQCSDLVLGLDLSL